MYLLEWSGCNCRLLFLVTEIWTAQCLRQSCIRWLLFAVAFARCSMFFVFLFLFVYRLQMRRRPYRRVSITILGMQHPNATRAFTTRIIPDTAHFENIGFMPVTLSAAPQKNVSVPLIAR